MSLDDDNPDGQTGSVRAFYQPVLIVVAVVLGWLGHALGACAFGTITNVAFGTYSSGSASTSNGSVAFSGCNTNVSVDLDNGKNASTFYPRQMLVGSSKLNYNLYYDAGLTSVWGDTTSGTTNWIVNSPVKGTTYTQTIYGQIPAGQNVAPGSYTDTVVITMTF